MPSGYVSEFWETVPELMERFGNFAFDGVVSRDALDDQTRMTAILAALIGCQGIDECRAMVPAALNFGAAPVEVEEIPYQAVAYLGIGRVFPFLKAASEVLADRGVALPLAPQTGATAKKPAGER
jgi:4-carboxymuconolactone decarboxylase